MVGRDRAGRGGKTAAAHFLDAERDWWDGTTAGPIAGVDEVGRGAWAGPLSVGVAVVRRSLEVQGPDKKGLCMGAPAGLTDSKLLSELARENLFAPVARWCRAWAVGHASPEECDYLGMSKAQRLAARRGVSIVEKELGVPVQGFIVDGNWDFVGDGRAQVKMLVGGDRTCGPVAAAALLAKVTRDRLMIAQAPLYPSFEFDRNKGYPSPHHIEALKERGPTPIHRTTWSYMDRLGLR
ncbi:MAG: ribonuclease HII [Actinobacteria bacterium]|nr:ribonuclease HII [Actinomycetota bacterium]